MTTVPDDRLPCANCGKAVEPDNNTVYMDNSHVFKFWKHESGYGALVCPKAVPEPHALYEHILDMLNYWKS